MSNWFSQECSLLPNKDWFRFFTPNMAPVSSYRSEVCHFVTEEVAAAKSVQPPPFIQNYKTYADLSSRKTATEEMG